MKKIDRVIITELFGPWLFGVAIFTVLIMAGSFLFQLTEMLSEGAPPMALLQLVFLLIWGVIAKTFSMAMLLAALLAFGRLSGDSEIVAMKAAGVSVPRMMVPVGVFAGLVALAAFILSNFVVPASSLKAVELRAQLEESARERSERAIYHTEYEDGKVKATLMAKSFSISDRLLEDVYVLIFDSERQLSHIIQAKKMEYQGQEDWRIIDGGSVRAVGTNSEIIFHGDAWPEGFVKPQMTIEELIADSLKDLDAFSMKQLAEQAEEERNDPTGSLQQAANLEFGYWNKISLPLAALVFGLLGAPLGIRSHRTGTAAGFWQSVIIIFLYLMLTNAMNIMSQGGAIPPFAASFTPIIVGIVAAAVLMHIRNG